MQPFKEVVPRVLEVPSRTEIGFREFDNKSRNVSL